MSSVELEQYLENEISLGLKTQVNLSNIQEMKNKFISVSYTMGLNKSIRILKMFNKLIKNIMLKLDEDQLKIFNAEVCPYCKSSTKRVKQDVIYGQRFNDKDVICCVNYPKCDSYVGTHTDGRPLGRLADADLRLLKKDAHYYFDKLWKDKLLKRNVAYKLLAEHIGLPRNYTHIGWFKAETCRMVISWAKIEYKEQLQKKQGQLKLFKEE